ncbi:MAG: hypothetical protein M3N41_09210 [Acidobacteriota bacterium]|nr:hypothetical protein [Acidobacteriota bacterium]
MISAYACLGVLFAAPAAAVAFSKGRPQTMREALWRTGKAVGYGEGLAAMILAAGVVTVSISRKRLLVPELDVLAEAALLGLFSAMALALLAGWMTLRFSAGAARYGLRAIFLGLLLLFLFQGQRLPDVPLRGVELSVALAALMVILLRREVHPR